MAERVGIVEVGPRDGLQNEPGVISVAQKVAFIEALAHAGLREIEVGSYVSPKWVPKMADTDKVLAGLSLPDDVRRTVLVPNMRGFEAMMAAPVLPDEIAVFVAASEGFSRANLNCSVDESFARLAPVVEAAQGVGIGVRGYLSCVVACPYDGPVAPDQVARVARRLGEMAEMEVSLGDTIGAGVPESVTAMLEAVLAHLPADKLAGHFHDTGGRACDNVEAALALGLRRFDAAAGGLGGCPYAPGAPGNVATEAVVKRVEALGYETGIDSAKLAQAATFAKSLRGGAA